MKRKNMARNALFTSIISLLLCVSMLVGTTFAWFTDTVTSGNNVIASGNLDIELDYATFDENGSFKEWKSVGGSDKLFDDKTLWEPGHTEVVYLRMSNAGSLDLKYQLGINITETTGTNVYNETFKLSDYIWMSVVNGVNAEKAAFATREIARQEAEKGTNGIIGKGYSKPGSMMSGDPDIYMAVVVYMPESVDNHANHLTGTAAPVITLGINLFATQIESEIDSFGPDYDGGAPWITAAAIDWYLNALDENPDATEFTITSAEDLAGLAAIVNGTATVDMATYATENTVTTIQDSFQNKTIKLGADIDLANGAWTPIGNASNGFYGTFDGNGHTIFNLNVSGTTSVGLFGYALYGGNVKNLTVKNATVKGNDYAGVIMGRGYTDIDNCHVENATVITVPYLTSSGIYDGGAKAGGVIGQLLEGAGNTVTNCSAKNVKIYGFRDIGGVVGMVHNNNSCSGNSSSNVTLGYVLCDQITADKNENAGLIYGRVSSSATVSPAKDSAENQAVIEEYFVSSGADLQTALNKGGKITLIDNIAVAKNETITVNNGITATVDLNGYKISSTADKSGNQELFLVKGNLTMENGFVEMKALNNQGWNAMSAVFDITAGGVVNLYNVKAENLGGTDMNFVAHLNNWGSATLNVSTSTLKATYIPVRVFNSGPDMNNVTIENTDLEGKFCYWVHNYTAEGCDDSTLNVDILDNNNTFKYTGKAPILYGFSNTQYFNENGIKVAGSADELKDALAKNEDISLTGDITVTGIAQMPDRNNYVEVYGNKTGIAQYGGVLDGNGHTITDANNDSYVIVTHGGTIKNLKVANGARGIVTYSPKADVCLDNVVVDGPGYALNSTEHAAVNMVVTNSTVNGWTSLAGFKSVSFTSCKLGENSTKYWQNMGYSQDYDRLFRVYSPTTYTKCEFQKGYYLDMSVGGTATLVNCTVNDTVITADNYADYITIELPAGKTLAECVTFA